MKLLIAGGGTGGHVFPALAIAQEWLSRGTEREVVLVGTQRGIEMKLVPQAGLGVGLEDDVGNAAQPRGQEHGSRSVTADTKSGNWLVAAQHREGIG